MPPTVLAPDEVLPTGPGDVVAIGGEFVLETPPPGVLASGFSEYCDDSDGERASSPLTAKPTPPPRALRGGEPPPGLVCRYGSPREVAAATGGKIGGLEEGYGARVACDAATGGLGG